MFILFVRHQHGRDRWLEMVDHADWNSLVRDAADYVMGEYSGGEVVGAVEVETSTIVQDAKPRHDLWKAIREEMRERPDFHRYAREIESRMNNYE